ncbi:MAG: hypothetical protein J1E82_08580 [Muribaculaceae bacterium]|nr:hypothetical protein [Muribaculaceae bacterium]
MLKRLTYILKAFFLILITSGTVVSCTDDLSIENPSPELAPEGEPGDLSIMVDDPDVRTRNINFDFGSTVKINTVWIGVFDMNGNKVADQHTVQGFKATPSGTNVDHIVKVDYNTLLSTWSDGTTRSTLRANTDYFIVAVANYRNVKARKNVDTAELYDLQTLLSNVKTWNEFNQIGIDTNSAYYDADHSDDVPVLAGFFMDETKYDTSGTSSRHTHIKVNQYASGTGVNLLPDKLAGGSAPIDALKVRFNTTTKQFYTAGLTTGSSWWPTEDTSTLNHRIFFRRLVANIVVNIKNENPDITISQVAYRRFNMPNTVYIIERTMLDPTTKTFPANENVKLSPNFADYDESTDNGVKGYWNDDDALKDVNPGNNDGSESDKEVMAQAKKNWQYENVEGNESDNSYTFSFQHFANKHWARNPISTYAEREVIGYDVQNNNAPYFSFLANDSKDFNNNASYFIIKMHIVDNKNNRCAEAEYVIHEGYTSDSDGLAIAPNDNSKNGDRLRDYGCARNLNYNYEIHVHSINNIFVNVNGNEIIVEGQKLEHRPDVGGRCWEFHYGKPDNSGQGTTYTSAGVYEGAIGENGGFIENAFTLSTIEDPDNADKFKFDIDMAFRLYGYDSDENVMRLRGYNYNFPSQSFSWLNGMWPSSLPDAIYYKDYAALLGVYDGTIQTTSKIDEKLFNTFKIIEADKYDPNYKDDYDNFYKVLKGEVDKEENTNYWMNLVDFIDHTYDLNYKNPGSANVGNFIPRQYDQEVKKTYHVFVNKREIDPVPAAQKDNYIRALYFCNRNGKIDDDGCTTLIDIYSFVQDPPIQ